MASCRTSKKEQHNTLQHPSANTELQGCDSDSGKNLATNGTNGTKGETAP